MDNAPANDKPGTPAGSRRTAFALAAVVACSVFATGSATAPSAPAPGATLAVAPAGSDLAAAEIVTTFVPPKSTVLTRIKSGLASWYGDMFDGLPTASGRIYNQYELTAAHKTLPFGSRVKVTDLRNRRSVVVTITDRGVLRPGRVIDLSRAAARQLRMVGLGVAPVQLELVTYPRFGFQH